MKLFQKKDPIDYSFRSYPHFLEIKPRECYRFRSDYFEVDHRFACILSLFHTEGAIDQFGPFWGTNRLPYGLGEDISIVSFEQVTRMTNQWVDTHQTSSEGIAESNDQEQQRAGTQTSRGKSSIRKRDYAMIAQELSNGASYLNVHYRLLIKAPTLEKLELALAAVDRAYVESFSSLQAAPYIGLQKKELSTLLSKNEKKQGNGFYYTSTELAGSYSLVTHGLEDAKGEYVGSMTGDVNNSAILFDTDCYKHHCVIADEQYNPNFHRVYQSNLWGSKLSQSCLLNNGRVVHMILDGTDLNQLGPELKNLTSYISLNHGDVNMFELFGDSKDELSVFSAQIEKLTLMAEQAYETTDSDRSIIRGSLATIITKFYVDAKMWHDDAAHNRDKLRIINIPHNQVPLLHSFVMYLHVERKAMLADVNPDQELIRAFTILGTVFDTMLRSNGDLFDTYTNDSIDKAKNGRRVIYDFSELQMRGKGVAMAQFVNVLGFAVHNLGENDTLIIHGVNLIDDSPKLKEYLNQQLNHLYHRGGRVCFIYHDIEKMIKDKELNYFEKADYTILGPMTKSVLNQYQTALGFEMPDDLKDLISNRSSFINYIRREYDNVAFMPDLSLGLSLRKAGN